MNTIILAVSYTHLDVYKRQGWALVEALMIIDIGVGGCTKGEKLPVRVEIRIPEVGCSRCGIRVLQTDRQIDR